MIQVQDENRPEVLQALSEKLQTSIVHFEYAKTDGQVRSAFGTLSRDLIPVVNKESFDKITEAYGMTLRTLERVSKDLSDNKEIDLDGIESVLITIEEIYPQNPKTSKRGGSTMPETSQMYYDFEAKGFRSFKKDNLVTVY